MTTKRGKTKNNAIGFRTIIHYVCFDNNPQFNSEYLPDFGYMSSYWKCSNHK